jgi:hypothetical protein
MNDKIPHTGFIPPNREKRLTPEKIKRKVKTFILAKIANTPLQFGLYKSYWHYKFRAKQPAASPEVKQTHFLTQQPNFGAGIGHQLANWNSGLYFAEFYNLKFAHSPFSTVKWEYFFGFGEQETLASDLVKNKKFKTVRLPRFDSTKPDQISLAGRIIDSYDMPNVLFMLELDQGYVSQWETHQTLSQKFFNAKARQTDRLIYSPEKFNIAVHVRRFMKTEVEKLWEKRGLENDYYVNALTNVLAVLKENKKVQVYLFSQAEIDGFSEFEKFRNIHYCLDMGPMESFLHLVNADLLISSKSSFSYKPALISKGVHICPATFWHDYPPDAKYILADDSGNFDGEQLLNQLRSDKKLSFEYEDHSQSVD